ncbi:MAG: ImmA/IrrE family metallo-endopeptidase [Clostridium sp.]|uniref:ImmA/IrrE family metallo-endopeptidase n=1 Tax=Clostridium sp. TaxID=1506 RepID=UPI003061D797
MYTWINDVIWGLCDIYDTNNAYELCDILNIKIEKLDCKNILLRGNDSLYIRNLMGNEVIFIRGDLSVECERFVLLHELGHAILHVDIFSAAFNRCFINTNKLEKQANYFAFKMLNIEFDEIELEGMTLDQISRCIGVPYEPLSQLIGV